MHRSACERRADVQHGIGLAAGRLIGTYDQVAGTIIGQLHPVQHHGTIDGLDRGERRDIGHIMEYRCVEHTGGVKRTVHRGVGHHGPVELMRTDIGARVGEGRRGEQ